MLGVSSSLALLNERNERTENGARAQSLVAINWKKERSHRNGGFEAYDEASGEHSGTIDLLGEAKWTPQLWARSYVSSARTVG